MGILLVFLCCVVQVFCGHCRGESHSDVPCEAPCPVRMDLYLSKHHELKSPLHASCVSLEDGPKIQRCYVVCVQISISSPVWTLSGANKSLNTHFTHYSDIIWNIDAPSWGRHCFSTHHAILFPVCVGRMAWGVRMLSEGHVTQIVHTSRVKWRHIC